MWEGNKIWKVGDIVQKHSRLLRTFCFAIVRFDLVNNNQHHSISFVKVLHWIGVYFVCMIYCLHYLVWYPVWGTTSLHYYMILCDVYIIVGRVAQWVQRIICSLFQYEIVNSMSVKVILMQRYLSKNNLDMWNQVNSLFLTNL